VSLSLKAAAGIRWTTLSMVLVTITQLIRLVVLGRILEPEAFGLLAMMLVATGFMELMSQAGLGEAIVQHPVTPTRNELSSLYWLNIVLGVLLFLVLLLLTPLIAFCYSTPELNQLLPWLALALLISPWGVQFKALLQRELRFKSLATVEITSAIIGTSLAIILAYCGYGVWSLVWGQLAQTTSMALILVLIGCGQKMLPRIFFSYSAVKPYISFGLHLLGSNSLNYFNFRVDQLVIGVLLGPQALGFYSMAFNLVLQPISRINPMLTGVAFPVLTKVRSDKERLKRGYFRMLNLLSSVNSPLLIGIAVVAPTLVPVALGDKWLPIIPLIQVLAMYALIRSMGNAGGSLVLACGRANLAFYWNMILFALIPISIFLGAKLNGLQGVAWTLLVLQLILIFYWYRFAVLSLLGKCFSGYIRSIGIPIIFTIPMVMAIFVIDPLISNIDPKIQLSVQIITGAAVYTGLYFFFRKAFVIEHLKLFFNRI